MSVCEPAEAWLVFSSHLRDGGDVQGISRELGLHWNYPIDESVFGLGNVARGLTSPVAGSFNNPLANGPNAIGRAVYWGLVFHGRPEDAARHAYFDAATDHSGDGVWIPVALARTIALLSPGKNVTDIVRDLSGSLPKKSKFLIALGPLLKSTGRPDGPREVREQLPVQLGIADPMDATLTASWLVQGLLHGQLDFERSVLVTAGCGGAAGHATLACAAICAFVAGDVSPAWMKPVGEAFVCGHGLRGIDPPSTVEKLSKVIAEDYEKFGLAPEVPVPVEGEEQPAEQPKLPSPQIAPETLALMQQEPIESCYPSGRLRVYAQYIDPPVAFHGVAIKMALRFENCGDAAVTLEPELTAPRGFELAHKLTEFVLEPGGSTTFAIVYKAPKDCAPIETFKVALPGGEVQIPVFAPHLWYCVGPMTNQEGTGFDKEYPAEKNIKLGQVFNGRSNLPVQWTAIETSGIDFDVEKLFGAGPGTALYYANVRFEKPGKYRIVVASGVGAIVWIDGEKRYWYHDTHTPVPRAVPPYVGAFNTEGESKVLIKTFRNLNPVPRMTVYFLAEDGRLAFPVGFDPID
jgi:hypothetical protein